MPGAQCRHHRCMCLHDFYQLGDECSTCLISGESTSWNWGHNPLLPLFFHNSSVSLSLLPSFTLLCVFHHFLSSIFFFLLLHSCSLPVLSPLVQLRGLWFSYYELKCVLFLNRKEARFLVMIKLHTVCCSIYLRTALKPCSLYLSFLTYGEKIPYLKADGIRLWFLYLRQAKRNNMFLPIVRLALPLKTIGKKGKSSHI